MNKIEKFNPNLLIALFLLVWSNPMKIYAQEDPKLKFGLAGGPSFNWVKIKTNDINATKVPVTFNYGFYGDFQLTGNPKYYFSTGILFNNFSFDLDYKAAKSWNGLLVATQEVSQMKLGYLNIPLGVKMRTDEIGYSRFAGWFGLGTGFRINSSEQVTRTWTVSGVNYDESETIEKITEARVFKASVRLGAEWERKITKETYFVLGATFENGLTSLLKGNTYKLDSAGNVDLSGLVDDTSTPLGPEMVVLPRSIVLHLGVYF